MLVGSSDVMVLVYAFGAGAVAILVLLIGLFGMFEREDREAMLNALRHPLRLVFGDDHAGPDPPE